MTPPPLKTPVAVPPVACSAEPRAPAALAKPLVGPIAVTCGAVSLELRSGSLLIGRLSECDLVIDDTLVSRMHARIYVSTEGVRLEDLHSTNGVYVNGHRMLQTAALNVGDHAVVGTQSLSFSEIGTEPAPPASSPPLSGLAVQPVPKPMSSAPDTPRSLDEAAPIPITARAEALDLLGTLARRLANEQKADQAPRMLGPHLRGILRGASSGLIVPGSLAASASEYAMDLAHWTADPRWLDYVVELHLVTGRLMSATTLGSLQRAERWVGPMSRPLLEYYVNSFAGQQRQLDPSERSRMGLLRRILKKK